MDIKDRNSIIAVFKETRALLEGHFLLTSGLHSNVYFQCARVFQYPEYSTELCKGIANNFKNQEIDVVVSPAVGGIVVGQEVARLLNIRSIFTERVDGKMTLRRGFELSEGEKVLVVEDVTTTGGSVKEVIEIVKERGANPAGVGAVVDRSGGTIDFGVPYFSLVAMEVHNYAPEECPMCEQGSKPVKPGSRGLK